jgi:DNA-binding response OmpR family regulator
VEDDEHVGELIATVLNEIPGRAAMVVTDAAAAVAMVQQVEIKVVVLDINLPGITDWSSSRCCGRIPRGATLL